VVPKNFKKKGGGYVTQKEYFKESVLPYPPSKISQTKIKNWLIYCIKNHSILNSYGMLVADDQVGFRLSNYVEWV
jgi:hypothetical protein